MSPDPRTTYNGCNNILKYERRRERKREWGGKSESVCVRERMSEKREGKNKLPTHCFLGSVKLVSVRKGRRKKKKRPPVCATVYKLVVHAKSCEHNRHGRTERDSSEKNSIFFLKKINHTLKLPPSPFLGVYCFVHDIELCTDDNIITLHAATRLYNIWIILWNEYNKIYKFCVMVTDNYVFTFFHSLFWLSRE